MSETILIVDDDPAVLKFYERLLGAAGFSTVAAGNGRAAVERIRSERPALVLMDNEMPVMSGPDALAVIRGRPESRTLPVIMVTGLAEPSQRVLGLEAGANDYLIKPVPGEELLARIRAQLKIQREWRSETEGRRRASAATAHTAECTVLFFDLRGWSRRSEQNAGALLGLHGQVRSVMETIAGCVAAEDGTVLQYLGDGILATWNEPRPHPAHVEAACRAARRMAEAVRASPQGWNCGVGIDTGELVAGPMGAGAASDVTVLGPVVNRASRVQQITKIVEAPVLVTGAVAGRLADPPARVGRFRPPGMSVELDLYVPGRPDTLGPALTAFEAGRWEEAYEHLAAFPPDDRPARFLRWLCETHRRRPPPSWDGVIDVAALADRTG